MLTSSGVLLSTSQLPNSPTPKPGVLQLNYPDFSQTSQVTGSVPGEMPHFRLHSQVPGVRCASDPQAVGWGFSRPLWNLFRFHNLLEWLTEPRKAVYLCLLVYCKGYSSGRGEGKTCRGQGVIGGWGAQLPRPLQARPPAPSTSISPPPGGSQNRSSRVFSEFSLQSHPLPDVRGGGGGAESPTVTTRCFR